EQAEKATGNNYSMVPTQLVTEPTGQTLETGKDSLLLKATVHRFGNFEMKTEKITWTVPHEFRSLVKLKENEDGSCLVIPTNNNNETQEIIVTATTDSGLESSSVLYIA